MARVATVNSANTLDKLYGTAVPPAAPAAAPAAQGGTEFYTSTPGAPVAPTVAPKAPVVAPLTATQTANINSQLLNSGVVQQEGHGLGANGLVQAPGESDAHFFKRQQDAANDAQSARSGGVLGDLGRIAAFAAAPISPILNSYAPGNPLSKYDLAANTIQGIASNLPNGSGIQDTGGPTLVANKNTGSNAAPGGAAKPIFGSGSSGPAATMKATLPDQTGLNAALANLQGSTGGQGGAAGGNLVAPQIAPTSAATVGQLAAGQQVQAARAAQVAGLGSANLMNAPTAAQQQIAAAPTAAQQQIAAVQNAAFNPAAFSLREYSEDTTNPDNALAVLKAATESASAQNIGNAAMARGGPAAVALAQREARGANAAAYSDLAGQTAQIQLQEDEARRARIAQAYNTNQGVLSDVYGVQQNIGANQALANLNARTNQNVAQLGSNTQVALGNANNATNQNVAQLGSNTQVALGNANNQNQAQISYQQTQAQRDIANQQAQVSQANLNAQLAQQASLANQSDAQARALAQLASQTQTGIANAGNASQQAIAQAQLAATTQGQQVQLQTAQLDAQMKAAVAAGDIASQQYIAQLQAQNKLDSLTLQKQLGIGVQQEPSSTDKALGAAKTVASIIALL